MVAVASAHSAAAYPCRPERNVLMVESAALMVLVALVIRYAPSRRAIVIRVPGARRGGTGLPALAALVRAQGGEGRG